MPDFLKDYVVIAAAIVAFIGVLVTVTTSNIREARKTSWDRRAAYRTEARLAVSRVLSSAGEFARYGSVVSDEWRWVSLGPKFGAEIAQAADDSMKELVTELSIASLVVAEEDLVLALETFGEAFHAAAASVHEAADDFFGIASSGPTDVERETVWARYDVAREALASSSGRILRSPVRAR